MKYLLEEKPKRRLKEVKLSKHVKILRELPKDADSKIANIHRRNEILKANKMYQMKMERSRANAALTSLAPNEQQNLRQFLVKYKADLFDQMFALGKRGAAP